MSESAVVKIEEEEEVDKRNDEENGAVAEDGITSKQVTIRQIFSHCSVVDYLLFAFGMLVVILISFDWSIFNIIFGKVVDAFSQFERQYNNQTAVKGPPPTDHHEHLVSDFMSEVFLWSGLTVACGLWHLLGNFLSLAAFQLFALRRMRTIKRLYMEAILRQEMAWFDKQSSGEFASRIANDFKKFEGGINENLAIFVYHAISVVISLAVGVYYGWKLSLAVMAIFPLTAASSVISSRMQAKLSKREMEASSQASSVAEEAIGAIRTVFAFGGQRKEKERYERAVKPAMLAGCRRNFISAIDSSIGWASMYAGLAIGIWYGVHLIVDEGYSLADVVIIYWSITSAGYNIGYSAPYLESLKVARAAAAGIFEVIERKSAIDPFSSEGKKLKEGYPADIEFRDVHFSYPSRPDVPVLRGLNLSMKSGETVALVGASGCGKSTVIQLVQRFYSPDRGSVAVGGCDVGTVNVGWLRQQMGVVGQEPVLFSASLAENITLGSGQGGEVSRESVSRAAKEANAHQFIGQLSSGYGTYVGDRGAQLSGGQKQRIAIARALVGHPRILLLDEATSALDLTSEQTVQTALHRASQGRTTLIVAHRLSTIRHAHRIVVLDQGVVKEMGTHEELMALQGAYYSLVRAQEVGDAEAAASSSSTKDSTSEASPEQVIEKSKTEKVVSQTSVYSKTSDTESISSEAELLKTVDTPHLRLFKLIWIDRSLLLVALFCAVVYGFGTPIYALIFGGFIDNFTTAADGEDLRSQAITYGLLFAGLAVYVFVVNLTQVALFGVVGERLTMRLRCSAFEAILRQKIAWFDQPENSTGALCSRLADDAASVQGATGIRVAMICQAASCLICSLSIGFVFNWRQALVSLGLMPIVVAASIISTKLYSGQAEDDSASARQSGRLLIEVINAIRTVVGLNKERHFLNRFAESLEVHYLARRGRLLWKSLLLSTSLAVPFFAYAVNFCYGGWLLSRRYLNSGDFFRIAECMVFGAFIIGETAVLSADYGKAKVAAFNIFKLIDQSPKEEDDEEMMKEGKKMRENLKSQGEVTFSGVHFSYPSRPETEVLSGLSFSAKKGETVALVGASGCGKSTTVQLLEQFYECSKGKILLDGTDISSLPVDWVRSQMSLVSQEPVLFSYSIAENIAYGDNSRVVGREEIVRAAEAANVHSFVDSLPLAYDTPVGGKGSQLSGGQKQRIAIARALLRDPAVLIMDEATSALDTASEKVVQQALEEAARGRTSLLIAHRLKTIQAAQRIVVLDQGRAVEEGTHQQLLQLRGHYYRLYNSALSDQ